MSAFLAHRCICEAVIELSLLKRSGYWSGIGAPLAQPEQIQPLLRIVETTPSVEFLVKWLCSQYRTLSVPLGVNARRSEVIPAREPLAAILKAGVAARSGICGREGDPLRAGSALAL